MKMIMRCCFVWTVLLFPLAAFGNMPPPHRTYYECENQEENASCCADECPECICTIDTEIENCPYDAEAGSCLRCTDPDTGTSVCLTWDDNGGCTTANITSFSGLVLLTWIAIVFVMRKRRIRER